MYLNTNHDTHEKLKKLFPWFREVGKRCSGLALKHAVKRAPLESEYPVKGQKKKEKEKID